MARLPIPGSDSDTWGTILNEFLSVSHDTNGTLKSGTSIQNIQVSKNGTLTGTRPQLNLIEGANITIAAVDNALNNRADITITAASGTPAGSIVNETSYGQASAVGTSTDYARADHTHGTVSLTSSAPATTLGIGTSAAVGVATEPARADHVHPMAAAGAPAASAVGDTQTTGAATTFAASDHVHEREDFGSVTALSSFNTASSDGISTSVARADHVHGAPPLATLATKTADQATTSITVENITDIALGVDIGTYEFEFFIPYTGSVSNGSGILLDLNGPTNSFLSYAMEIQSSNSTNSIYYRNAFASNQAGLNIVTAGTVYTARVQGVVTTTASGTLQPRFGITNGSTTTTAKAGCFGKLQALT